MFVSCFKEQGRGKPSHQESGWDCYSASSSNETNDCKSLLMMYRSDISYMRRVLIHVIVCVSLVCVLPALHESKGQHFLYVFVVDALFFSLLQTKLIWPPSTSIFCLNKGENNSNLIILSLDCETEIIVVSSYTFTTCFGNYSHIPWMQHKT